MIFVFALLISLVLILVGIVRFQIHPFFVLLLAAIIYGFLTGMDSGSIVNSINTGFGNIMGNIGLIIFFGVVIGTVMERSGGVIVLANKLLKLLGEKSIHLAMMVTGFFISIPVFSDSGFVILNPLTKALTKKANVSFAGTAAALALGLLATHVMVPPTPGPVATAAILNADLGSVILWGTIVSIISLIPSYFFITRIVSKIELPLILDPPERQNEPKFSLSFLCIAVPILLIVIKSILEYSNFNGSYFYVDSFFNFFGSPVIALLVGVALSFLLPEKLDEKIFSANGWVGESVVVAAPIILITGAGGIFGAMLQNSGIADWIADHFMANSIGIFFPFLLAALLKTAQGSSTVAMITAASIILPMLPALNLDDSFSLTLATLAIGAGSLVVSHVNDSFFWVVTQLTGMNVKQGNKILTLGSLVLGVSAIVVVFIISVVFS